MNVQVEKLLGLLRADYESVTGSPFQHFFCPILYRDEDTELCRAHVINRAFRESGPGGILHRSGHRRADRAVRG